MNTILDETAEVNSADDADKIDGSKKRVLTKEESIELLQTYIDLGINFIRKGRFLEAQDYFHKSIVADNVGIKLGQNVNFLFFKEINPENLYTQIERMYNQATFYFGRAHLLSPSANNTISISEIYTGKNMVHTIEDSGELTEAESRFFHDVALINAEEWLHALQHLKGSSLTGEQNHELDVAFYLKSKGVKLTRTWLDRYKVRGERFSNNDVVD